MNFRISRQDGMPPSDGPRCRRGTVGGLWDSGLNRELVLLASAAASAPRALKMPLQRETTAELDADIARLEKENAAMEAKLKLQSRPSFINAPVGMARKLTRKTSSLIASAAGVTEEETLQKINVAIMGCVLAVLVAVALLMLTPGAAPPPPPPPARRKFLGIL